MGKIIYSVPIDIAEVDFSWMIGRNTQKITFNEPRLWSFVLAESSWISTESFWRVLEAGRFAVTGEDHGHKFGLPTPVDCVAKASSALSGATITDVEIHRGTLDLILRFDGERQLEIFSTSHGYENWQVRDPTGNCFVAQGGSRMCTWKD